MKRAFILVFDSFGVGAAEDASPSDKGANTFGHIAKACVEGKTTDERKRKGPLHIPNLVRLGLNHVLEASTGAFAEGVPSDVTPEGLYGYAVEKSAGKDTPSGHWEMAGVPVLEDWGYFSNDAPCFPDELIDAFVKEANLPGVLGNCHASGTEIINRLAEEHIKTGKPIVYTSADSVFQIAAHETYFGLEKLYQVCDIARKLVDPYRIGRVIARPFVGEKGSYKRTANRKDLATPPPEPTLLDCLVAEGGQVVSVGKIADIFAHQGITKTVKGDGNMQLFDVTLEEIKQADDRTLVFANFVDFDSSYGHRRNVSGYANALEEMDARLPELEAMMRPGDLAIITADHGCDPTWEGSDHTREHIPIIAFGPGFSAKSIGRRQTFADIGQTIALHLGMSPLNVGQGFLDEEC